VLAGRLQEWYDEGGLLLAIIESAFPTLKVAGKTVDQIKEALEKLGGNPLEPLSSAMAGVSPTLANMVGAKVQSSVAKGELPEERILPINSNLSFDNGRFDYIFGRVNSGAHNADRSNQLALEMERLGIRDDDIGREIIKEHFEKTIATNGNVLSTYSNQYGSYEVIDSFLMGPSGQAVKIESTF
jgi:hypothetical protein